jgi:hypothetical protein
VYFHLTNIYPIVQEHMATHRGSRSKRASPTSSIPPDAKSTSPDKQTTPSAVTHTLTLSRSGTGECRPVQTLQRYGKPVDDVSSIPIVSSSSEKQYSMKKIPGVVVRF